ncbi:hypothetical protein ABFS83_07G057700 [Erythranthe nasuta]
MATYTKICVFLFLMMASVGGSMGDQYMVGDSSGWNSQGTDYKSWASTIQFYVNDVIFFNYNPQIHDVMQVSKSDFEECIAGNPLAWYKSGSDTVQFFASGNFYFICSYPGMCPSGQKVEINVLSRNTTDNPTSMTPPLSTLAPPHVHPYYWGFDNAASTNPLCFHHHFALLVFASCVLFLNLQ